MTYTPTDEEIATAKSPMPDEYLELLEAGFDKFLSEPPVVSNMFVSSMMVRIRKEQAINSELVSALKHMEQMYVELINSCDCGFWDVDTDKDVTIARAALAKAGVK